MAQIQARKEASNRNCLLLILSTPSQLLARHRPVPFQNWIFNSLQSALLSLSYPSTTMQPSLSAHVATTSPFYPDTVQPVQPLLLHHDEQFPILVSLGMQCIFLNLILTQAWSVSVSPIWERPAANVCNLLDMQFGRAALKGLMMTKIAFFMIHFLLQLWFLRVVGVKLGLTCRSHSHGKCQCSIGQSPKGPTVSIFNG